MTRLHHISDAFEISTIDFASQGRNDGGFEEVCFVVETNGKLVHKRGQSYRPGRKHGRALCLNVFNISTLRPLHTLMAEATFAFVIWMVNAPTFPDSPLLRIRDPSCNLAVSRFALNAVCCNAWHDHTRYASSKETNSGFLDS